MKKPLCIILFLSLLLVIATCQKASSSIVDEKSNIMDFEFQDLAELEFRFSSGAGAWSTIVKIQSDGTFNGHYNDRDAGVADTDYPYGTEYECYFNGNFTSLKKISDYEYSMKCESLTIEGVVGQEEIKNGVRIITSEPYGFDNANEFLIYLPGIKLNQLPDIFLGWVHINPESIDSESMDVLTFYGLYNVGGEQGFNSYEK